MITVMDSVKEIPMRNSDKSLDSQLWHACAGGMVQMPPINSKVFYFPQGHAEHALGGNVDFGNSRIPSLIPCRVNTIRYMADPESDEVYAKLNLVPLRNNELNFEDDGFLGASGVDQGQEKLVSFAKTLTQSDANNGGGFSVPRYCAETIFPRLDYNAEPPVQTILAKDVHGGVWKFRHIYRGTPRRHLLTTGWSNFVNRKKLVAGDSIVFLRAENGDLCVGIRRAKRGIGGGIEYLSGWNQEAANCGSTFGVYSSFMRESKNSSKPMELGGKVRNESVVEAATLATNGKPFEVVYYPRASTPEFFVKASVVRAAMEIHWSSGMRFKMPFETEDSSRISWFMGTISAVQVADPVHWPDSPWRLLQVAWDEPDLLQNVKCVNPWLVELVSNIPVMHIPTFSPPRKKMRFPQQADYSLISKFPMPSFSNNLLHTSSPFCGFSDNIPAGIQGARHAQFGISSEDLHHNNKMHSSLFPIGFQQLDHAATPRVPGGNFIDHAEKNDAPCLLTMGNTTRSLKDNNEVKAPHIVLFGQLIYTEEQISKSCSGDTIGNSSSDMSPEKAANFSDGSDSVLHQNVSLENSSDGGSPWYKDHRNNDLALEPGHCKVFVESVDVGWTLDLSSLGSYEELYVKLAKMFRLESSQMLLYQDALGAVKHTGEESFSEFVKTARRLTVLTDSGSDNIES
ncbi:auxin response factor 18-like [Quercus lobata]|uniref:Auxin response factor n=1 Tax=Quercus lobata TaxID=97700 RepID=A0A7N2MEZ7_QUELO|nr:auxin response factor 18-like [Quercus lobata]XP_030930446.1 auxin response factor 18-like [Quercus lobata]